MNEEDLERLEDLVFELGETFVDGDTRSEFLETAQHNIETFIYSLYQEQ